jgi:hypothetical protein
MAITKENISTKIEIQDDGCIGFLRKLKILEDDEVLCLVSKSVTLIPGSDVSSYPKRVRDVCASVWTPEVIAAYQAAHP